MKLYNDNEEAGKKTTKKGNYLFIIKFIYSLTNVHV